MTTRAFAKINLGLRILGKREDGYHNIETAFHRISLFDEIIFEPSSTLSLSCNHHDLPTDDSNLCVRAAGMLQKVFRINGGVHITLKKNIPVGAGLGGGSSDAAAVLKTLPSWWNETIEDDQLFNLALELGADVPYFLKPGTAYATGKGEILEYFDLDIPYWIVVVYPNMHISTAWAYQNVQIKGQKEKVKPSASQIPNLSTSRVVDKPQTTLKDILLEHLINPRMLVNLLPNDFEPLVLRTHEPVAKVKKGLYDSGAVFAQMSGSGSSVYGLFVDEPSTLDVMNVLGKSYQGFLTPPHFTP